MGGRQNFTLGGFTYFMGFFWAVELLCVSEATSELAKNPAELERAQKCSELEIRKKINPIYIPLFVIHTLFIC